MSTIQEVIAPLGHTIIALSSPPNDEVGDNTIRAWIDHINSVGNPINQKPVILVIPFSDVEEAENYAAQVDVETSYRVLCVCYHGAYGYEPELAAAMAAALADSNDPAVPFNGVNLGGIPAVEDQYRLTFERIEAALNNGICMIDTGADGVPEILRAISTYRVNPDTGIEDDLMLDINGALIVDYTRKVIRTDLSKERRRKNTAAQRRNVRSIVLKRLIQLEDAEILQNVRANADQLTVTEDPNDRYRANVSIPTDWVRGMHVIGTTLNIY
ncbi:hypothetical protein F892_03115 [Acinetobacter vivianii]|uniref:Tail sheath protein C-terminal domain-containing protein n=1 Tax=Acinetobacter vivianii TaxID=1776742 RepID=N9PZJ4_9GAMM|nr:phage tail sheath C-terminal domain-containing protein [Acinetobacter vivianii]ENX20192.1 hypothetical protein F892_03115 [Acinetobacter vivianii]GGI59360.1 hypothetical protein GCM10011446_08550 [Acinetobacter vivianii]